MRLAAGGDALSRCSVMEYNQIAGQEIIQDDLPFSPTNHIRTNAEHKEKAICKP